jgi:type II secretory pathway pseudopilin PulG
MHFHLPKPLHGWREFAGEVAIIVLGVLIALSAEQIVQSIHERNMAAEARENVRDEAALNLDALRDRIDVQNCIERRLDEISRILDAAGDGPLQTQTSWIGMPPTWPFFHARWEAATASGRNSLFPFDEQQRFSQIYEVFSRYDE